MFVDIKVNGRIGEAVQDGGHVAPPQTQDSTAFNDFHHPVYHIGCELGSMILGGDHGMHLE